MVFGSKRDHPTTIKEGTEEHSEENEENEDPSATSGQREIVLSKDYTGRLNNRGSAMYNTLNGGNKNLLVEEAVSVAGQSEDLVVA